MKNLKLNNDWLNINNKYTCPYCKIEYSKKGILTHIWRKHGDGVNHNPNMGYDNKNRIIWNKGKNKSNNKSVEKFSNTLKNKYTSGEIIPSFKGKKHTNETKLKISIALSKNNKGGRCKWYSILNNKNEIIKVQGTWELRFAKILNIIDTDWIKISSKYKNHSYKWIDDYNKLHTYTPDFWSPKLNKYYEIKVHWWGNDKRKMELIINKYKNINIEIIQEKELIQYEKEYSTGSIPVGPTV